MNHFARCILPLLLVATLIPTERLFAADSKESVRAGPIPIAKLRRSTKVDFEKEVLPIFRRNCLSCHNSQKPEEGLSLETPADILKGGDSGPAVVARKGDTSLLLKLASHQRKPVMPPAGNKAGARNLSPEELALVKLWIDQGATGQVRGRGPLVWQPVPEGLNPILAVALTEDGQFAAAGRANQIFLYQLPTTQPAGPLADPQLLPSPRGGVAHRDLTYALAFSPDGTLLASGSHREVKLWRRVEVSPKLSIAQAGDKTVSVLAASPDGRWLATAEESTVKLWSAASGALAKTLSGHTAAVRGLRFSPDNSQLLSGSADKSARVWNLHDGTLFAQIATPAEVNAVTWSADGKQFVTGGADNLIRAWKLPAAAGGTVVAGLEFKGHTGPVTALDTVGLTAPQFLSGSADGSVRLWNPENGQLVRQVAHGAAVTSVAARADGKVFASAGTSPTAKLWNTADGKLVADLKGDRLLLDSVAARERDLSQANSEITYQRNALKKAEDDQKKADDASKKAEEERAKLEKTFPEMQKAMKEAEEGKTAAEKRKLDAEAAVKQTAEAKESADKAAAQAEATAKASTDAAKPDAEAKSKAAGVAKAAAEKNSTDATAKLKEATDQLAAAVKKANDSLAEVRKYSDAEDAAKRAASDLKKSVELLARAKTDLAGAESSQKQTEAESATAKKRAADAEKPLRSVAFSRDGKLLATSGDDGVVRTWSADSGGGVANFGAGPAAASGVAFAGNDLVMSATGPGVTGWNSHPEWRLERTIGSSTGASPLTGRVIALQFSPDGTALASGSGEPSRSGELKLWNVADGTLRREFTNAHSDTVQSVDFSADGRTLVSGAADKFVKVWEVANGKHRKSFEGHTHQVLGVSLKRDGRIIASAGADNAVKLWSLVTGEAVRTIQGFTKEATSIAHVGGTDQFVATGGDGKVRLINEAGGDARTFAGASDFVYSAAASPDGRVIIAGGQDSVLRVWNAQNGQLIVAFEPPKSAPGSATSAQAAK